MNDDQFTRQITKTQQRINQILINSQERKFDSVGQLNTELMEALEGLSQSLEELQIAEEEIRTQNEELISAHSELESERQRYQKLFQFAPDCSLVTDQKGIIMEANRAAAQMFALENKYLIGKPLAAFVFDEDLKEFRRELTKLVDMDGDKFTPQYDWEIRFRPRSGPIINASISFILMQDITSQDLVIRWIIRDISDRVGRTNALRNQYTQIHLLQEIAVEANHSKDINEALEYALQLICSYTDFSIGHIFLADSERKELISTSMWHLEHPERYDNFRKHTENLHLEASQGLSGKVFASGKSLWVVDLADELDFSRSSLESMKLMGSGLFVPLVMGEKPFGVMELFSSHKLSPDEDLLATLSHIGSLLGRVLEREMAAKALQEHEALFRSVFEQSDIGILLSDLNANIVAVNPAMQKSIGYQENELLGKNIAKFIHPDDMEEGRLQFSNLVLGKQENIRLEARYLSKTEGELWARVSATLVNAGNSHSKYVLAMVEDITWQKQTESELLEVERYLARSREEERQHLAQELHDGPMQDLYSVIYQLSSYSQGDDIKEMKKTKNNIQDIIHSLRRITGELRPPALAPFGLEKGIQSHINKLREYHPDLSIEFLSKDGGRKLSDVVRINLFRVFDQAMTNIIRHAQANNVFISLNMDNQKIILDIRDDGIGFEVPERWVELVRQDHFGLVGAAERVHSIGGQMSIQSTPGKGTFIRVSVDRDEVPTRIKGERLSPFITRSISQ